jgi:site-specific recombinase XerD
MPRLGKRKRLDRGIYEDKTGRAAICLGKEKRFPPETPLKVMRAWQESIRRKYKASGRARSIRGTLADAVNRWDGQETHLASWRERRAELRAWVALYGDKRLTAIDDEDVRRAISVWTVAGVAPKTIRNRLWSLQHLYKLAYGKQTDTPVDEVERPAKVRRVITPTAAETILFVYGNLLKFEESGRLRDAKTRARYMVRASTGRRPCEIMRAQPTDVDVDRREWRVRDAKGGWSEGIYLNDDMLIAWMTFIEADAWGPFNTGSQAEVLRAAGWPEHSRPYNLRHSVGMSLSEQGVDLADVGGWLGQTDIRTTRGSYVPILKGRMQRSAEAIEGRLFGWNLARDPGTPFDSDS